jgi:CobQ-like glutamine amidotransferase family enzyme
VTIKNISLEHDASELMGVDLVFMGGAQDSQQSIVSLDFKNNKGKILAQLIEDGIPGLYICGAYQLLGRQYESAEGTIIEGLGIFDLHTKSSSPSEKRLIGNAVVELNQSVFGTNHAHSSIVGFENHGGRTYLGANIQPLGTVTKGFGNNGTDSTEGAVYKNSIGSYFHGPLLPKNPHVADFLIEKALEKKYGRHVELALLDDTLAYQAHTQML